jgi:hypothetical protein
VSRKLITGYLCVAGFSVGDSLGFEPALEEIASKRRSVQGGRSANIGVQAFAAQVAVSQYGLFIKLSRKWMGKEQESYSSAL